VLFLNKKIKVSSIIQTCTTTRINIYQLVGKKVASQVKECPLYLFYENRYWLRAR